jgi:hypothetical protein
MPASVLVAVFVVAGIAILLPSLVRRFDRAERGHVELRDSSMRVISRRRRRRTVPGRRPVRLPSAVLAEAGIGPTTVVGRVAVPGALVPGRPEADAEVRAALVAEVMERYEARRADARTALAEEAAPTRRTARARAGVGARFSASGRFGARAARTGGRSGAGAPAARARAREARARARRRGPGRMEADPAWVRRWWRYRRRRVLVLLALLVPGQVLGVVLVGPGFWTGVALSALVLGAYVLHLRGVAASDRRRRERLVLRRRRARILAREAALAAGVAAEVEAMVAEWLAMPRTERREPPSEEVVAVLAAGGQEVVQAGDGTWYPREIPLPLYVTAPRAPAHPAAPVQPAAPAQPAAPTQPARPAAAAGGPSAYRPTDHHGGEEDLPRAANL